MTVTGDSSRYFTFVSFPTFSPCVTLFVPVQNILFAIAEQALRNCAKYHFLKQASSPVSSYMLILILETMILASLFVYQLVRAHVIIARSQRAKAGFDSQAEIKVIPNAFFMA